MKLIQEDKSVTEVIGEIIGKVLFYIAISYWLLFTLNTFLKINLPYDFAHVFASYFIMVNFHHLIVKTK